LQYQVADPEAWWPVELAFGWGRALLIERDLFGCGGCARGAYVG
jgi:hypothetical protein